MKRRLINTATVLSLMLMILVLGLGVHSCFSQATWGNRGEMKRRGFIDYWLIGSFRGRVCFITGWTVPESFHSPRGYGLTVIANDSYNWPWIYERLPETLWIAGFNFSHLTDPSMERRLVAVPDYLLVAIFGILPIRWWMKRRTYPPGHCPTCGYDLRATPERCPECGAETWRED